MRGEKQHGSDRRTAVACVLALVLLAAAGCAGPSPSAAPDITVSPIPTAAPTAPSAVPSPPTPTPTPTPWPPTGTPTLYPLSGPTDRLAVVDHSGLFLNAAPTSASGAPSSGPDSQSAAIYVRRTDDPASVVVGWWNVGRYCHTGPVLTIGRVGDELHFTVDLGPVARSSCLLVLYRSEALIRFRSSVAALRLVAELAAEQTPLPTSSG